LLVAIGANSFLARLTLRPPRATRRGAHDYETVLREAM
jgi:hypothetical protein